MMITISTEELQKSFEFYLQSAESGEVVVITKDGKAVAKLVPPSYKSTTITDSLKGVLKNNYAENDMREEKNSRYI